MKGYRNYQITLEHVTDLEIDSFDYAQCTTEEQARKIMTKMSTSKKAQTLKTQPNNFGMLPSVVRVYAMSNENDNDDWIRGVHVMIYEDGICTYSSVG